MSAMILVKKILYFVRGIRQFSVVLIEPHTQRLVLDLALISFMQIRQIHSGIFEFLDLRALKAGVFLCIFQPPYYNFHIFQSITIFQSIL